MCITLSHSALLALQDKVDLFQDQESAHLRLPQATDCNRLPPAVMSPAAAAGWHIDSGAKNTWIVIRHCSPQQNRDL